MFQSEISIPHERVAVLIGRKGFIKRYFQKKTNTKIKITKEGDVFIEGEDNLNILVATTIVKAIGRGFNPEIARSLLNENNILEIIDISDVKRKSKNKMTLTRGRLIGTQGKARQTIESMTDTRISIYGKTVAIIGGVDNVHIAKAAVEKLILGSKHGNAYKHIQLRKSRLR